MKPGDEEHEAEHANAHTLEHAQRARFVPEYPRGIDGVSQHAGADERAGEIDLLSAV
jgi:hypothetical protein